MVGLADGSAAPAGCSVGNSVGAALGTALRSASEVGGLDAVGANEMVGLADGSAAPAGCSVGTSVGVEVGAELGGFVTVAAEDIEGSLESGSVGLVVSLCAEVGALLGGCELDGAADGLSEKMFDTAVVLDTVIKKILSSMSPLSKFMSSKEITKLWLKAAKSPAMFGAYWIACPSTSCAFSASTAKITFDTPSCAPAVQPVPTKSFVGPLASGNRKKDTDVPGRKSSSGPSLNRGSRRTVAPNCRAGSLELQMSVEVGVQVVLSKGILQNSASTRGRMMVTSAASRTLSRVSSSHSSGLGKSSVCQVSIPTLFSKQAVSLRNVMLICTLSVISRYGGT